MIALAASAAFVGLIHSLAPGHWLPVVLVVKMHRWPVRTACLGALVAAAGHILVSGALGILSIPLGQHLQPGDEEKVESWAGLGLIVFGIAFALYAYFRHSSCHGHEHHGADPDPEHDHEQSHPHEAAPLAERVNSRKAPFLFLFLLGISPCVAVLPIFGAAALRGSTEVVLTLAAFSLGVLTAFISATVLVSLGILKLDHPVFEHYGDVITGVAVAALGAFTFFHGAH